MIICTTDAIPGREIKEILGLVKGNTVRAKHVGRDIMAGFKNIAGGEIKSYTSLLSEARDQAIERMTAEAAKLGADAIVEMRLTTSQISQMASEVLAYGTAVKF